ncbi:MAG: hypothetical protein HPY57_13025 [Ignavibacteria bacterium]|nr:hypothetical protein [Ignavibacteria bacterium]
MPTFIYEIKARIVEVYEEEKEASITIVSDRQLIQPEIELKLIRGDYEELKEGEILSANTQRYVSNVERITEINPYTIKTIKE